MLGALCIPLSMAPMQALASASGTRRSRGDERDVEEPEAAPGEKPIEPDIAWEALTGEMLTVSRGDLPPVSGKLVGFDDDTIVLAVPNGSLLTIQREEVTSVRHHVPPPAPRDAVAPTPSPEEDEDDPPYKAHVITGSIIVGVGGTLALAGLVMVAVTAPGPQCDGTASSSSLCGDYLGSYPGMWAATVVAPGLAIVASGAAVLGVGMKRKKQNEERRAKAQVRFTPRVQRSAWGGNLQLRF